MISSMCVDLVCVVLFFFPLLNPGVGLLRVVRRVVSVIIFFWRLYLERQKVSNGTGAGCAAIRFDTEGVPSKLAVMNCKVFVDMRQQVPNAELVSSPSCWRQHTRTRRQAIPKLQDVVHDEFTDQVQLRQQADDELKAKGPWRSSLYFMPINASNCPHSG